LKSGQQQDKFFPLEFEQVTSHKFNTLGLPDLIKEYFLKARIMTKKSQSVTYM